MKIVMLCEFYNEELDYQEVMLAKYYRHLCHDVVVIAGATTSVHDYMAGQETVDGQVVEKGRYARIYRMPVHTTLLKKIVVYRSIKAIIEDEKPDLLYFHDIIPNMLEGLGYLRRSIACRAGSSWPASVGGYRRSCPSCPGRRTSWRAFTACRPSGPSCSRWGSTRVR